MNQHVHFWLNQQQRKVDTLANGNAMRMGSAQRFADVIQLMRVPVPPEVKSIKYESSALASLMLKASQRIRELMHEHEKNLMAAPSSEEAHKAVGRFRMECEVLRGYFPREYHDATAMARKYIMQRDSQSTAPAASNSEIVPSAFRP